MTEEELGRMESLITGWPDAVSVVRSQFLTLIREYRELREELDKIDRVLASGGAFDQGSEMTRTQWIEGLMRC